MKANPHKKPIMPIVNKKVKVYGENMMVGKLKIAINKKNPPTPKLINAFV